MLERKSMVEENKKIVRTLSSDGGKFFVSHFDILGYKSFIQSNPPINILVSMLRLANIQESQQDGKLNLFYAYYDTSTGQQIAQVQPDPAIKKLHFTNYSDTIIMYFKATDDNAENLRLFKALCKTSNFYISKLMINSQVPEVKRLALRCGIAYGPGLICEELGIHAGQVFIDAYELCENQSWMGGSIHSNVPSEYYSPLIGYNNELFPYEEKIPIKKGCSEKPKYALNWVNSHPALPPWYPKDKRNRDGPLLLDIGGHVIKFNWESKNNYEKANNTLNFIVDVDEEWNRQLGIQKSTEENLAFPTWYKKLK